MVTDFDAKYNFIERITREAIENDDYKITDEDGEKFIHWYLELTRTTDLDPLIRLRFTVICINDIPTLVFKHRGLITPEEFNAEIDRYIDAVEPQSKIEFIRLLYKDGDGAVYSRDMAEFLHAMSTSTYDGSTNWQIIGEHVEELAKKYGLVDDTKEKVVQNTQQYGTQPTPQPGFERAKGSKNSTSSGGCFVATAIYGSYDCPQVWTLRRYRDYVLAKHWYGRAFIHTYYAISPTIVKWFGSTEWFNKVWHKKLDKMVESLKADGFSSSPYTDKDWKE